MSYDQSELDNQYFIDTDKYNCPYCNRRSVTYSVTDSFSFDWTNEKKVFGYLVSCGGDTCKKTSLHLTNREIRLFQYSTTTKFDKTLYIDDEGKKWISINDIIGNGGNLDELFFLHQPTTFFTLDNRINSNIRELISEAEGCAKMGHMVGASGCLRKAIYKFLQKEYQEVSDVPEYYEDKIKALKDKYFNIDENYFDALSNIQDMASKHLHEGSWKVWKKPEFDFLLAVVKELLMEIYVRPEERSSILKKVLSLKPKTTQEEVPDTRTDNEQ